MIFACFGKARHDSSICVYDNGKFRYAKFEREVSGKHHVAPEKWYYKKLSEWGINIGDIEIIVETDHGTRSFDQDISKTPMLPLNGELFYGTLNMGLVTLDHHYAHAFSDPSFKPNQSQAIVVDAEGSGYHTAMRIMGQSYFRTKDKMMGEMLEIFYGLTFPEQTSTVGWEIDAAGKVMGLVSYGTPIKHDLNTYHDNPLDYVIMLSKDFPPEKRNVHDQEWIDCGATLNELCYRKLRTMFEGYDKNLPLIYSGGVALNIDYNRRLLDDGYNLSIQPHVYDGGLSIGCMNYVLNMYGIEFEYDNFPYLQDDECPDSMPTQQTIEKVAELLAQGKIVGWYQGHGEIGPRALGNRSILMNPSIKDGKDILNSKVKGREWWRPFGASVLEEDSTKYFDIEYSPYMLVRANVLTDQLPAVTHVDGSCRPQTVNSEQNLLFYKLINEFKKKTGLSVVLNTSLNLGGKPIAGTIREAVELFETSEMDALCIGDRLVEK